MEEQSYLVSFFFPLFIIIPFIVHLNIIIYNQYVAIQKIMYQGFKYQSNIDFNNLSNWHATTIYQYVEQH